MSCCRLVKCLPCVTVYMSSLTIMAIAVDRHRVICKPTFSQVGQREDDIPEVTRWLQIGSGSAVLICVAILLVSIAFCLPLIIWTRTHSFSTLAVEYLMCNVHI